MRSVLYIAVISVLFATLHGCGPLRSAVGTSYDQQLLEALNAPPGCAAGDQRVRSTVGNAQRFAEAKARTALTRSISIEVQNVMELMTAEGTNVSEENASSESRQETNQALRGVVTKSRQLLVDNDQNKTVVVTVCLEPKNYDAKTPGEALEVMLARTKERLASAAALSSVAEPATRGAGVASAGGSHGSSIDFNKIYSGHHALVIGVDDYHSPGLKDLGGAVRDAKAIGAFLNARGFKVTELLNKQATRKGIKSALRALAKDVKERDRVIVFFAGHGVSDGAGDAKMGYLMPHDADPQLPDDAGIEMDWLQRRLDGMKAKHVMFLADACYSGIAINTRGSAMPVSTPDYVAEITKANVRLTMTAGTDGQEAMEYQGHGLFTYFLLDALKGAADRDRDGFITSLEISQHLATQVPAIAKRKMKNGQTPQTGRMGQGEMVFRGRLRPAARLDATAKATEVKVARRRTPRTPQSMQLIKQIKELAREPNVKVVALEFFASWCTPCVKTIPRWQALKKRYGESIRLVVVDFSKDDANKYPMPHADLRIFDEFHSIASDFGLQRGGKIVVPSAFLWSWTGHLIMKRGHIQHVEAMVDLHIKNSTARLVLKQPDPQLKALLAKKLDGHGKFTRPDRIGHPEYEFAVQKSKQADIVTLDLGVKADRQVLLKTRASAGNLRKAVDRLIGSAHSQLMLKEFELPGVPAAAEDVLANSKSQKNTSPKITASPNGGGSGTGRQTEWGIVETVDQSEAKRIRAMVNGVQRTYERPVLFEPHQARLLPSQGMVLTALADYLKISPDVVLVMIEGRAHDFDGPGKDRALSEARASAVRKFLVGRGVDVNRTIAYGVGRSQPSSDQHKTKQGVVLYLVSGKWINKQPSESVTPL